MIELLRDLNVGLNEAPTEQAMAQLSALTNIPNHHIDRLGQIWGAQTLRTLLDIAETKLELNIRLLAGSLADYGRAVRYWWRNVETEIPFDDYSERPTYFVSSNTHTLANLLSGYALAREAELVKFMADNDLRELQDLYQITLGAQGAGRENLLYYILKKFEQQYPDQIEERIQHERQQGIYRIAVRHTFDIEVQLIALNQLASDTFDGRLLLPQIDHLKRSDALIINIDYPLGMAANLILEEIVYNLQEIRGIFSIGKAATLNGRIGDVMIPSVIHDEHSLNTYLFDNCFVAEEVVPYLQDGSVMDNQKAITVLGTFLQNEDYMSVFYEEGYTDMEMEGGPFLSTIYEMVRPKRHPHNEVVDLHNAPFLVGFLHYASDTPFSKGNNLGSRSLSFSGMDSSYAVAIATLRKIIASEV
ncbi:MAG: hypothetical protein KC519_14450 [Anaerolineae bacterium]|nr:hypothetical protein [Anaerolineae bacterium]